MIFLARFGRIGFQLQNLISWARKNILSSSSPGGLVKNTNCWALSLRVLDFLDTERGQFVCISQKPRVREPHLENHYFRGHLTTPGPTGSRGSSPRPASVSFSNPNRYDPTGALSSLPKLETSKGDFPGFTITSLQESSP